MANQAIVVENLEKTFHVGDQEISILKDISFDIPMDDFAVIFGPSGSGKSTLLHGILGLEPPSKGSIYLLGQNIYASLIEDDRSDFRKKHIGMVYQQPNWIKSLSVIENITFPLLLLGIEKKEAIKRSMEMLESIHMAEWADYVPTELSSGQQQRISLARAIVTNPEIIIADEPTGNLDFESGQVLMQLLLELNKQGRTIVMVTHDLEYISFAKTAIQIFDGKIEKIYKGKEKEKLTSTLQTKKKQINPTKNKVD